MKPILKEMIKIYRPKGVDWLGFKINKKNPFSYHHIFKNVYGDYSDMELDYKLNNGAILSDRSQKYIHSFETTDLRKYNELNNLLLELNRTRKPPTEEHWQKVKRIRNEKG